MRGQRFAVTVAFLALLAVLTSGSIALGSSAQVDAGSAIGEGGGGGGFILHWEGSYTFTGNDKSILSWWVPVKYPGSVPPAQGGCGWSPTRFGATAISPPYAGLIGWLVWVEVGYWDGDGWVHGCWHWQRCGGLQSPRRGLSYVLRGQPGVGLLRLGARRLWECDRTSSGLQGWLFEFAKGKGESLL